MLFNASAIENLVAGEKDYYVRDEKTHGLNLKVTPVGRKVFLLRYRVEGGKGRKLTMGVFPRMSVAQAREAAWQAWAAISKGEDPSDKRVEEKRAVTVEAFSERYLSEQVNVHAAKSTQRDYASMLRNNVVPLIGAKLLKDVTREDVERIHRFMHETPARANRTVAVIKAMYNKAGDWGVLPYGNNPALRVRLFKEVGRTRYFDEAEQRRIALAIKKIREENPISQSACDAIQFLFRTGCRTKEALNLRWTDIDFEMGEARLRTSKTGQDDLILGNAALELLQSITARSQSEWVFPGRKLDRPLERLKRPWDKVCKIAQLEDAHLHDIRHTVGTYLAAKGRVSTATFVLRHKNSGTTDKYKHPHFETIKEDLDKAISGMKNRGL